jgi:PRTRC genetic system protein F
MFRGYESSFQVTEGGIAVTPTEAPTALVLSLPKIDMNVPAEFVQAAHPSIVLLGRRLAEIGVLTRQDVVGGREIDEVIKDVFAREIEAALGELQKVRLDVDLSDGIVEPHTEAQPEHTADEEQRIHFAMSVLEPKVLVIGETLAALEEIRSGLGQTVYAVLERVAQGSLGLFTFDYILEGQPWMYYLDEREDLEAGEVAEDNEDDPWEGMPTRAELLEGTGVAWANNPRMLLTPRVIKRIRNQESTPEWARKILDMTLNAADAWVAGNGNLGDVQYWGVDAAYQLAVVRFSDDDELLRMYDDHINNCNQSSDSWTDNVHVELVDLRDTVKFQQWWEGVLAGCRLIHSIDALLDALTCQPT